MPHAHLTYLVEEAAAPVVRHDPALDAVIEVARPGGLARLAYDLELARRLRAARFDVVIDFHGGPRSAWLARATGARRRIGYAVPGRGWLYTDRRAWSPSLVPPRHSVVAQWDLLAPLGIAPPSPATDPVVMAPAPDAAARVEARLRAAGVAAGAPLVVMHVSASNPFRRWPRTAFAEVAAALAARDRTRRIIITSGPSEADAADAVAAEAAARPGVPDGALVRAGEFDLTDLRALVAQAALYVGGDSGPLHIAATTGTPIVAVFGPTLPERSMPWRAPQRAEAVDAGPLPCRPCHQRACVPGDFRCLTGLAPAAVTAAAERLLGTNGAR